MTNENFLSFFPGSVVQFFDDDKKRGDEKLAETTINFNEAKARERQALGCGVYFSVNGFKDGRRLKNNLTRLNALYIDLDISKDKEQLDDKHLVTLKESALQKISNGPLKPHFIVETRHGLHCLWLIEGFSINDYACAEEAIIKYYGADPGAKDVCRVLRMPGTYHLKDLTNPFLCKLIVNNTENGFKKYTINDIRLNYDFSSHENRPKREYKQPGTTPNVILRAKKIPIKWVIETCAQEVGIQISWKENTDHTLQIIEDGEITSGFINQTDNIAFSASGKPRKGDTVNVASYYLCLIGNFKARASQIAEWLLDAYNN